MKHRSVLGLFAAILILAALPAAGQTGKEGKTEPAATPTPEPDPITKGDALLRAGKFDEALQELLRAQEMYPANPDLHLRLGIVYGAIKPPDPDKALKHLQHAVALEPDSAFAVFMLAQEYAARKQWDYAWLLARKAESLQFPNAPPFIEELKKHAKEPAAGSVALPVFEKPAGMPVAAPPPPQQPVMKPIDASAISGKAQKIAEIKAGDTQRTYPITLSWAPDDSYLVIQSFAVRQDNEGVRWADPGSRLRAQVFKVDVKTGKAEALQGIPEWVPAYWSYKSAMESPGKTMTVTQKTEAKFGIAGYQEYHVGGKAVGKWWREGHGATAATAPGQDVSAPAAGGDSATGGETLGAPQTAPPALWHMLYAGLTFSWAPPGGEAMAYVNDRTLKVLDSRGNDKKLDKGDFILPAWSHDGKTIALVEVPLHTENWIIQVVPLTGM